MLFSQIPFSNFADCHSRMTQILQSAGYTTSSPNGRNLAFNVSFGWADFILIDFISNPSKFQNSKEFVLFSVYPGNTKGQGQELFKHPNDWINKTELLIGNVPYSLDISYHIKFSYTRSSYMTELNFEKEDLRKDLYTVQNFNKLTGESTREEWPNLEKAFDECFVNNYHWRNEIEWFDNFINHDRKQFNIAFGYCVKFAVPYTQFQHLDINGQVPVFFKDIENAVKTLIP